MAKTPSGKSVAATSGQGVSRLAYQKAHAAAAKLGMTGGAKFKTSGGQALPNRNDYSKTTLSAPDASKSQTYDAPSFEQGKPPKPSASLKPTAAPKIKAVKEDSGFIKEDSGFTKKDSSFIKTKK